jgi:hypothetical protein
LNLTKRVHEIFWELDTYEKTGNPEGFSVALRYEFWKTGIDIILPPKRKDEDIGYL